MRYSVGQILFLLLRKDKKVIPVRIIEEVVRKTLDEEKISYVVIFPDKKSTTAPLENIDAEVFKSPTEVKDRMVSSAVSMIDDIISKSVEIASQNFDFANSYDEPYLVDSGGESQDSEQPMTNPQDLDLEGVEVDLGNGVKARVKSVSA
jgi:hypothetical protein